MLATSGSDLRRCRGVDLVREELGVVFDPAEERRAARVLPRQTEEVEAGDVGDAAAVAKAAVAIKHRKVDPRVIGPIPRRPDQGLELLLAAVGECDRSPRGGDDPRPEGDAVVAFELTRARTDERVAGVRSLPESRVERLLQQPELRQPPEQIAAEQLLRQRRLARADRELDGVTRRQLLRYLEPGIATADDEDAAVGHVT